MEVVRDSIPLRVFGLLLSHNHNRLVTLSPGGTWLPRLLRELLALDEIFLTSPLYC